MIGPGSDKNQSRICSDVIKHLLNLSGVCKAMKAVDGGKFYKEYLLKTSFKGETSEPCNPYFFLFPLNSWSFSFFFFSKQYLPPTTSNDEQLFFCVLLVWSVLHPTPESNMEQRGGKIKSKKGKKVQRILTKKREVSLGDFFMRDPNLLLFMTRQ